MHDVPISACGLVLEISKVEAHRLILHHLRWSYPKGQVLRPKNLRRTLSALRRFAVTQRPGKREAKWPESANSRLVSYFRVIQDYLGHRDPKHTMIYTRIAGSRFEGLWR